MRLDNYSWVLFDADDTLFHFDSFMGLKQMFAGFGLVFTEEHFALYQSINKPLWVEYQQGKITADYLQTQRFSYWASLTQSTPQELNHAFLMAMGDVCRPIEGVISLLNYLKPRVKIGIITNGFTQLQQTRIERTGLKGYFDVLVISEQIGYAKPHPKIFDHTLNLIGNPPRHSVLMVGDNPDTDIVGGIDSGLHTCWFNPQGRERPLGVNPHYEVASWMELEEMVTRV